MAILAAVRGGCRPGAGVGCCLDPVLDIGVTDTGDQLKVLGLRSRLEVNIKSLVDKSTLFRSELFLLVDDRELALRPLPERGLDIAAKQTETKTANMSHLIMSIRLSGIPPAPTSSFSDC